MAIGLQISKRKWKLSIELGLFTYSSTNTSFEIILNKNCLKKIGRNECHHYLFQSITYLLEIYTDIQQGKV